MQLLTGMYTAKVDEKGRLSLPSRLRTALSSSQVVVLPGLDGNHLMLMTPDYFENQFCTQILSSPLALMDKEKRKLVRKIISPAVYLDIDSAGRINVPQRSREAWDDPRIQGVVVSIDEKTKKAIKIEIVDEKVDVKKPQEA